MKYSYLRIFIIYRKCIDCLTKTSSNMNLLSFTHPHKQTQFLKILRKKSIYYDFKITTIRLVAAAMFRLKIVHIRPTSNIFISLRNFLSYIFK